MFQPGLESFLNDKSLGSAKINLAVVSNHTGRDKNGVHLINRIVNDKRFCLKKVFSPEHGFNSTVQDGVLVSDSKLNDLNLKVISLYGATKKPSVEMLQGLDLIVYDIQDVGVRFYTYISTLRNVMETASEAKVPFAVLERPNILGHVIEGPMLEEGYDSFVSHLPVYLRYGMTSSELAVWIKKHYKLTNELLIYKCSDYDKSMIFNSLDFPWFKPSPNMPDVETAMLYPATCFFEGTQVSEGRGTDAPFKKIGAPWINANLWLEALKPFLPAYVKARTCQFTPVTNKYQKQLCNGIHIKLTTETHIPIVTLGFAMLYSLIKTHPGKVIFEGRSNLEKPFIDYLAGTNKVRKALEEGQLPAYLPISQDCR